jgi:post-segregation antitoxin (ccd killing protein)
MPKVTVYVDDDLFKRIKKYSLPTSQICQAALWTAIEGMDAAQCECGAPASFRIENENGASYGCRKHAPSLIAVGPCMVRPL